MTNTDLYGRRLRDARKAADKTMEDVANFLGISTVYVSDVERGKRAPWHMDRTLKVAEFLRTDPSPLLAAAVEVGGAFVIRANNPAPNAQEVGAALMRGWDQLTPEDLNSIRHIVEVRTGGN